MTSFNAPSSLTATLMDYGKANVQTLPPATDGPAAAAPVTGDRRICHVRIFELCHGLKMQFDEVQNLRRDLSVLRQLYTEYWTSTETSLGMRAFVDAQEQAERV